MYYLKELLVLFTGNNSKIPAENKAYSKSLEPDAKRDRPDLETSRKWMDPVATFQHGHFSLVPVSSRPSYDAVTRAQFTVRLIC